MRLHFLLLFLVCFVLIEARTQHSIKVNEKSNNDNSFQPRQSDDLEKGHRKNPNTQKQKSQNGHSFLRREDFMRKYVAEKSTDKKCGYNSCANRRKDDKVNVHIINHTHDDVGWLKTVSQYYYGARNDIQRAGVQYIITSVIDELRKDPKRKFMFVEIAFFKMWWDRQDSNTKLFVKQLVNEGRFEFISGGWSMNDEAAAHYISIIDQMTLGHQWLLHTFGECAIPKIGWQIDPFGHSREQASLFAQMGFDGLFFGRLDYEDKGKRENETRMEIIWRGSDDLRKESDLFTGVLPNGYNPPGGFCFDDTCADEPINDDPNLPDYNVDRRVEEYVKAVQDQAKHYKTKDIIQTMGSDFQYQNALVWYTNLDLLMKYVEQKHPEINMFYSTPTCYLKALNDANITWPTKTDDFFPYSSDPHAYWAGYFTSRPAFKGLERWASGHLQSVKHLQVLADLTDDEHNQLRDRLREALGVSQHHDAITGTEKQAVYSDYVLNLDRSIEASNVLIEKALNKIYNTSNYSPQLTEHPVEFCRKLNVSECSLTEQNNKFALHLYNPMSHHVQHLVRLPIKQLKSANNVLLLNSRGKSLPFDVVDIADHVKSIPERNSVAEKELVFLAELNATSLSTFLIDLTNATRDAEETDYDSEPATGANLLESGALQGLGFKLYLDTSTGQTQKILLDNGKEIKFEQNYAYYVGAVGDNKKFENRSSGAYIFRPLDSVVHSIDQQTIAPSIICTSKFVEVHTKFAYISNTLRVHQDLPYIEYDYVVGPIPVDDNLGKEIISVFKTDLKTNGQFYTDSNGRQLLKRTRNSRPEYSYNSTNEPIASNYYPLNSKVELRDEERKLRLAVLLDRSQGGTSMHDGELELMIHRRLLNDDAFGVGEALNEPGLKPGEKGDGLIIRGKHRILINSLDKSEVSDNTVSELAARESLHPMYAFRRLSSNTNTREIYVKTSEESILRASLPRCINLLTLESFAHYKIVRFEHLYGKMDQDICSDQTIEIDINQIFNPRYKAFIYGETYLTTNQVKGPTRLAWRSDFDKLDAEAAQNMRRQWELENEERLATFVTDQNDKGQTLDLLYSPKIKIQPSEIKTFLIFLDSSDELD